jgi:hypothetical protein
MWQPKCNHLYNDGIKSNVTVFEDNTAVDRCDEEVLGLLGIKTTLQIASWRCMRTIPILVHSHQAYPSE